MVDVFLGATLDSGFVDEWFDNDDSTWNACLGTTAVVWHTAEAVTLSSILIKWSYGDLVPGFGAAAAFTISGGSSASGPWTTVVSDSDPVATAGASYPGDFEHTYDAGGATYQYWRFQSTTAGNNDIKTLAGLAPDPIVPKVTFTINSVEFTGLLSKELRVELNGTGYVHFSISRGDAQATEANLARGNLIQVTIPEIHSGVLFEAILEEGDFDLLSSDEEGGQELQFGGPGTLSVLRRSVIAYEEYLDGTGQWKPKKGRVVFDADVTEGHIVNKLIREAQAAGRPSDPIPMVTKTFDATDDSNGDPWGDETLEGNWKVPMGAVLYDEVLRLVRAGLLHVEMAPGFELNLYRAMGTDRTSGTFAAGKVRFVGGVNIAEGLARGMAGRDFVTHAYIRYGDGDWTNAAKLVGSFPYEQEMFFDAGNTSHANTARRAARGEMGWRETTQEALLLSHIVPWPGDAPDDATGLYLPGPTWSDNGRYWVGDLVTVDTGSGEFDYDNATHRVYAITLREDATGYLAPPILELNAPYLSADSASSGLTASPIAGGGTGSGGTIKADLGAYQQIAEKGEADGYASLDADAVVPVAELATHAELAIEGGQSIIAVHGAMGATETFDPTAGNVHTGTLDADCVFTLGAPAGSGACLLELEITGSGTHAWTWLGSVTWPGGVTPDPPADGELKVILVRTLDGGTSWLGFEAGGGGGGGTPATTVEAETTFGIASAVGTDTEYARQDHTHGTPSADAVRDAGRWERVTEPGSSAPPVDVYSPDGTEWVYSWVTS